MLDQTENTSDAGIGHNRGPAFNAEVVEAFTAEAQEIADAASEWAGVTISTKAEAGRLKDFLDAARAKLSEVEARRKEEKEPFLKAGKDIDAAFTRVKDIIEKAGKLAKAPLEAFAREQQRIEEEKRRAEAEAARKAAEEAERERQIAERNRNAAAIAEAEEKAKAAAEAAAEAAKESKVRIGSATGSGKSATSLRTVRSAKMLSLNSAFMHYSKIPAAQAELEACILRMANADIRASKGADIKIPGIEIITEQKL